jgi:two-component system CheB/CheR fusion protein
VFDNMTAVEREVRDAQGRRFALRVRPYKNLENRIEGAVLTLFDLDRPR